MRWLLWLLVMAAGFGLMLLSYWHWQRIDDPTPWTNALMYVGNAEPGPDIQGLDYVPARARYLPPTKAGDPLARGFEEGVRQAAAQIRPALARLFDEKVILYPRFREEITEAMLASGRLPRPGAPEILAGAEAKRRQVGDPPVNVVGVLRRQEALLAKAYVMAPDCPAADWVRDAGERDGADAYVLRMDFQAVKPEMRKRLSAAFPKEHFRAEGGLVRAACGPYYLYLAGMALLLTGGSGFFVRLWTQMAGVMSVSWLRGPFEAMRQWCRLLAGIHVAVFGTTILGAALIYLVPPVQTLMLASVQQSISDKSNPLGMAGEAYMSGSIPYAAAATVTINFLLGSVASITVPSVVVPGIGALLAWCRAGVIGMVLAPTVVHLSATMLAHSFTILVEMEGYILAAFFAVLIPIYIFRKSEGPTWWRRYGRALLLNVKANVLVLAVLLVAAVYEAIEVILQLG